MRISPKRAHSHRFPNETGYENIIHMESIFIMRAYIQMSFGHESILEESIRKRAMNTIAKMSYLKKGNHMNIKMTMCHCNIFK